MDDTDALKGGWFSTTDLKLAVSLRAAGFEFKAPGAECTRMVRDGKTSFTWHFRDRNASGDHIGSFVRAWAEEAPDSMGRPDAMTCFYLAREVMFSRTHIITESHKVPEQLFRSCKDKPFLHTPRLGREEIDYLRQLS
jgi:hypothetical protein